MSGNSSTCDGCPAELVDVVGNPHAGVISSTLVVDSGADHVEVFLPEPNVLIDSPHFIRPPAERDGKVVVHIIKYEKIPIDAVNGMYAHKALSHHNGGNSLIGTLKSAIAIGAIGTESIGRSEVIARVEYGNTAAEGHRGVACARNVMGVIAHCLIVNGVIECTLSFNGSHAALSDTVDGAYSAKATAEQYVKKWNNI